jgi:hypothetical protein
VPAAPGPDRIDRTSAAGLGHTLLRPGRFPYSVGEGFEIVTAGPGRGRAVGEANDLPAARGGQPPTVLGAEVIAMGLCIGGEGAEDRGRVGVDVRQRSDGGAAARSARTATYRAHGMGPYRTLERAATTRSGVTPPCRGRVSVPAGPGQLTCAHGKPEHTESNRLDPVTASAMTSRSAHDTRSKPADESISDMSGMHSQ